jgi:hypothetical protein
MSKSKLVLSECNDLYFIAIAFIAFTLHEIKQRPVFFYKFFYRVDHCYINQFQQVIYELKF